TPTYLPVPVMPTTYTSMPASASAFTAATAAAASTQLEGPGSAGLPDAQQLPPGAQHGLCCTEQPSMLIVQSAPVHEIAVSQLGAPSVARITIVLPASAVTVGAIAASAAAVGVPPAGVTSVAASNAFVVAPLRPGVGSPGWTAKT